MLLERIKKHIDFSALKEESRKMAVNFITAGMVGVFIYHYLGTNPVSMMGASQVMITIGLALLYYGIKKSEDK